MMEWRPNALRSAGIEHVLAFQVLNTLLGCPPEIGRRVATGMVMMFEGTGRQRPAADPH